MTVVTNNIVTKVHVFGADFGERHLLVLHGVCKLEFYDTAADQSPFHEQWYRKDSNPEEVCGHPELSLSFDPSVTCAKCCVQYKKNEEWLKCTMCNQWFHEKYFYM